MKKNYIIPNQKVALIDAESLLANSPKQMQMKAESINDADDVWTKGENNFGGNSQWNNEW